MKKVAITALLLAAALLASGSPAFSADEDDGIPGASSYEAPPAEAAPVPESPFTLIVLGTRYASDVTVIEKNVRSLSCVRSLVPSLVSQMHIEYRGAMACDEEALIADIQGLAADRFEMKTARDRGRGLVITLRKIGDSSLRSE